MELGCGDSSHGHAAISAASFSNTNTAAACNYHCQHTQQHEHWMATYYFADNDGGGGRTAALQEVRNNDLSALPNLMESIWSRRSRLWGMRSLPLLLPLQLMQHYHAALFGRSVGRAIGKACGCREEESRHVRNVVVGLLLRISLSAISRK